MEQMDLELEKRVWERVSGNGQQEPESTLQGMELRCMESAAAFRQMSMAASGDMKERLMKLHRQEHGNAMAIRGMRILSGEEPEAIRGYSGERGNMRRGLAQAFRRSRKARADYAAHGKDGEYAPVFRMMEEEEGKRMEEILELMGSV